MLRFVHQLRFSNLIGGRSLQHFWTACNSLTNLDATLACQYSKEANALYLPNRIWMSYSSFYSLSIQSKSPPERTRAEFASHLAAWSRIAEHALEVPECARTCATILAAAECFLFIIFPHPSANRSLLRSACSLMECRARSFNLSARPTCRRRREIVSWCEAET